jgi:hypothetical protein
MPSSCRIAFKSPCPLQAEFSIMPLLKLCVHFSKVLPYLHLLHSGSHLHTQPYELHTYSYEIAEKSQQQQFEGNTTTTYTLWNKVCEVLLITYVVYVLCNLPTRCIMPKPNKGAALNPIAPDVSTQFESCTIDKDALITA